MLIYRTELNNMRLDKYLAHATGLSRKEVKRLLYRKEITVNSTVIKDAAYKVVPTDEVSFNQQIIGAPQHRYLMLNKPQGYVCSNDDPTHPTVAGLLDTEIRANELHIAGRLDVDTTGLVLVTTDGQWLHKITSPNHKRAKRYLVETVDPISVDTIKLFAEGVQLKGEKHLTKPAILEIIETHIAYLTLTEGKYHQVKRMFASTGNKVLELHRDRIGEISLDENLALGEYRVLTEAEISSIQ